jgi:penicillin-binding protein-related factor A (putative recombinase)
MTEKDLYPKFSRYISTNWDHHKSAVFELKLCKGTSFNKHEIAEHQIRALKMAKGNGVYHKISDQSIGQKPFDSFIVKGIDAFLVICFMNEAYFIHVYRFLEYMHDRISMREEEAKEIAEIHTTLK